MPRLIEHYTNNPKSLIATIFGLYICSNQYFVVMQNAFASLDSVDHIYDIKGSAENARRNELKAPIGLKKEERK